MIKDEVFLKLFPERKYDQIAGFSVLTGTFRESLCECVTAFLTVKV
jgi:hypothetical protein